MSRFPFVNKYLGTVRLVADLLSEAAMILMRVSQDDSANIRKFNAVCRQLFTQNIRGLGRFRPDIDQRDRIFLYQINIDIADIERRGIASGIILIGLKRITRYTGKRQAYRRASQNTRVFACLKSVFRLQSSKQISSQLSV